MRSAGEVVTTGEMGEYAVPMPLPENKAPLQPDRIRLAHISDPHLTSLSNVSWRELLNKRVFGYLSWRWRRRYEHRREILAELTEDLIHCNPDHIVITGDLTHVGTPRECSEANGWLHALGPPDRISVIPGNHDCYALAEPAETVNLWLPYMLGDSAAREQPTSPVFPYLRRRGPAAIIGLSSAAPSPIFLATGSVGRLQLATLESVLEETRKAKMFRILL
ncbi:MAG: metallophosphoesterase family protein, partial [Gammaproteobacteria bacterium]